MSSERPKPLHRLCGRPMLMYVLDCPRTMSTPSRAVIVVGHKGDWVTKKMQEHVARPRSRVRRAAGPARHRRRRAGRAGRPRRDDDDEADVHRAARRRAAAAIRDDRPGWSPTTGRPERPRTRADGPDGRPHRLRAGRARQGRTGCARIVEQARRHGRGARDRRGQHLDLLLPPSLLAPALRRVAARQRPGRVLPDRRRRGAGTAGHRVEAVMAADAARPQGVNDRLQLAVAEAELRRRTNDRLLRSGVTMLDPSSVFVDTTVTVGRDVTLFPGRDPPGRRPSIGDGTEIGPNTRLVDCVVGRRLRRSRQTTARTRHDRRRRRASVRTPRSAAVLEIPSDFATGAVLHSRQPTLLIWEPRWSVELVTKKRLHHRGGASQPRARR